MLLVKAGGPAPIVVLGGVVSAGGWIVQVWVAGVASVLPAGSVARTRKVCAPRARPVRSRGLVQAANGAASSEHSNVEPASVAEKAKVALVLCVVAGGADVIVVFGGAVSTVQERVAGVGSVLPAGSVARTAKVWAPSARPV